MTWLGSRLSRGVGRLALCVVAAATAAVLMSPAAVASPESDAGAAIDQTWQAAGGPDSVVGDKDGDVYQVGDGYGQNFVSGKIFFTPATGAHLIYGEILNRYQALGGPADSDLGFPTIDEAAGLVGPDSRVSTFSGSDKPVIFWTPDTGAWVVRGAINAAWDKLGGSAGTLGVPIEDETYNGNVISQKFSGGELSYDSSTKTFSSVPPDLASNLTGVDVPTDATAAINQAWRAAGGISGPLGARQGAQTTVGDDGAAQGYAGGKIFYSPATGAHAVTGAILSKYESAGGPTGDLGFPNAAEADGGAPNSRVSTFSAPDKPVIFWTPDTGAVVVRGAINAAWDKLGGATGKLGVPTGEQSVDGDTVTQKFANGEISWDKASGAFSTKPADLASSLSGVEVPAGGPHGPGTASGKSGKALTWHWWWLLVIIPILLLIAVLGLGLLWLQRRRAAGEGAEGGYDDGDRWPSEATGPARLPHYAEAAQDQSPGYDWAAPGGQAKTMPGAEDVFDGDPDSIDTTPTRIPVEEHRPEFGEQPIEVEEVELLQESTWAIDEPEPEIEPEPEPGDSGRHAAVDTGSSSTMWRLDLGEYGAPRRRRAAEEDPAEVAEPPEYPAADFEAPEPDDGPYDSGPDIDEPDHGDAEAASRPAIHLPLADPYQAPEGYSIKANTHSGLYYTPESALYDHTVPEVWFASEELAQANGFVKAPE